MPVVQTYRYILIGLASILLICALKNYIVFFISDTELCKYLCPSTFESQGFRDFPGIKQLFLAQQWLQDSLQVLADRVVSDRWGLFSTLIAAPVIEEAVYRGPMYLARSYSHTSIWWLAGIVLTLIFTISHGRNGIAMMPIIALGLCSLWLVFKTQRLWPSIVLHFLYNFIFLSLILIQSMWASD